MTVTDTFVQATATSTDELEEPAANGSGWSDTGDGIYLEANYAEDGAISVTVTNCTVSSLAALAIRQYPLNIYDNVTFTVVSGVFSSYASSDASEAENFDAKTYIKDYLASGSTASANPEATDKTKSCIVQAGTTTG